MADKCFVQNRFCTGKKNLLDKHYLFLLFCKLDTIWSSFLPELLEVPLGKMYYTVNMYSKLLEILVTKWTMWMLQCEDKCTT